MLQMKETPENIAEMETACITVLTAYQKPSGKFKLNRSSSRKVKSNTDVIDTNEPGISRYETNLFNRDFVFLAKDNLTGSEVYDICEGLYVDC